MSFDSFIKVEYDVYASTYSIKNKLPKLLNSKSILGFDTETRSVYNKVTREEAKKYLKTAEPYDSLRKQALVVAESSGLSYPSIVRTTHFIFGETKDKSNVVVCDSEQKEMLVWKMVADYAGTFLVHNSLFDLKIMFQRLGKLPKNYIDTALLAKCIVNHVNIWKAKTGLKELVGSYYDPKWSLMNDYEPDDLKNKSFMKYAATDGCAVVLLYELIQEMLEC
jgi:hypothetical protein